MYLLKATISVFALAALGAFASAGIMAWNGAFMDCLGPLAAGVIFGTPALFMAIFAYADQFPLSSSMPTPPPPWLPPISHRGQG